MNLRPADALDQDLFGICEMRDTLDQLEDPSGGLPWLREALALYETGGTLDMRSEPVLNRGLARLDQWLHIGIPWCGAFVGHCLSEALPDPRLPRWHLRARPWTGWGQAAPPQLGAILVFGHLHRLLPSRHVGFYWAEDADCYHLLGGNQHDRVTIRRYPKQHLIACRWPKGFDAPGRRRAAEPERAALFN